MLFYLNFGTIQMVNQDLKTIRYEMDKKLIGFIIDQMNPPKLTEL